MERDCVNKFEIFRSNKVVVLAMLLNEVSFV